MNPLLLNNHLRLRAPEPEDLELFYRWENDTSLWQHGPTITPISRFVLREYLQNCDKNIYTTGQLRLMIETHSSPSTTIGTIDLFDFDPYNNRIFLGMLIDKAYQHQGYGQEALALTIHYCFAHLHLHQLCVHIPISNHPCIALYRKNGFTDSGLLKDWIRREKGYEDVHLMQLINPA